MRELLNNRSDRKLGFHALPNRSQPRQKARKTGVQARSRNTVEVILEAAARILAADGWAAFNTNAVARIAGVSIGSVYEYFANKEAILDVLLDRHLASGEAQIAGLAGIASDALSLDEIVRLLVEGFIAVHQDNPSCTGCFRQKCQFQIDSVIASITSAAGPSPCWLTCSMEEPRAPSSRPR